MKTMRKKLFFAATTLILIFAMMFSACDFSFGSSGDHNTAGGSQNGSQDDSQGGGSKDDNGSDDQDGGHGTVESGELSIHFLDVGNYHSGDCILIKVGDTEVLIDAGSLQSSASTLVNYIDDYCTDGILEYVIVTHGDTDHIGAFIGTSGGTSIFKAYECGIIIDSPLTSKTTNMYKNYQAARDAEVEAGATHYTAIQCYNNQDGAQRSYDLGAGVTMNILYNYYYDHTTSNENDYSVCILITQGENNFLFTGDLEEKGEKYLVDYNNLPKCKLYKAGHHGSGNASTEYLLQVIQPEIVCIPCCAGSVEYAQTFPYQSTIDRLAVYTENIYVVNAYDSTKADKYYQLNGNIVVKSDGEDVTVECSGTNAVFKDTAWFAANRTWPSYGV